jgi:hypothetical protein
VMKLYFMSDHSLGSKKVVLHTLVSQGSLNSLKVEITHMFVIRIWAVGR